MRAQKRPVNERPSLEEIRRTTLDLFETYRDQRGAPFDESDFLADFSVGADASWWRGYRAHRRRYRFFDRIEDQFEIYIGYKRKDEQWSLDQFCVYLERAIRYRKSGLHGAEYANERGSGCMVQAAVLLLPFVFLGVRKGEIVAYVISAMIFACFVAVIALFLPEYLRYRKMLKKWR